MDSPTSAPGQGAAARPAGWHYRDARGRACGPYDDDALIRLYRFGHVRGDTPVWSGDDPDTDTPLRQRRDRFRLHGDGRLDILPPPAVSAPVSVPSSPAPAPAPDENVTVPTVVPSADETGGPAETVPPAPPVVETEPLHATADAPVAADVPTAPVEAPAAAPPRPGPAVEPPKKHGTRRLAIAALAVTVAVVAAILLARLAS
ncbi:DUF4339 domain-containing protein [Luteimonas abyssi]|uniref:DUF4339 domain-containing protein n=1 Tax=Luteimonas abyssi TaxID=1247514 RepID=UPI000737B3EC|nr:DUF4339 domain-containing protein [Luteimonas abyssi]